MGELAAGAFPYISMGGAPQPNTRLIIDRFLKRGDQPPVLWTLEHSDVEVDGWLQAAQPLVVPENVVSVVGSHWARGRPGTVHVQADWEEARIHHYVDLISQRCRRCTLHETGMRMAAARLSERLQVLDSEGRDDVMEL